MSTTVTTRRIAYVPALHGHYAVPSRYDVATITSTDGAEDNQIRCAAHELTALRDRSRLAWEQCVDTAETDGGEVRRLMAEDAKDECLAAWADAIRELANPTAGEDATADARGHLERARALAQTWGDDQDEQAALALLSDESQGDDDAEDATYAYSIYDSDPDASSVSPLDDCEDIEIEATSLDEALTDVRDALEIAAAGCSRDDGYDVGDRLYALVRMPDGTVEKLSHTLTEDDLG